MLFKAREKDLGIENNILINGLLLPIDSFLSGEFEFRAGFLWTHHRTCHLYVLKFILCTYVYNLQSFGSLTVDSLSPEGTLKLKWNFSQNGFFFGTDI